MTRPTIVCFAREASAEHAEVTPKVFLRALLYTTAKRGLVVENLFLDSSAVRRHKRLASGHTATTGWRVGVAFLSVRKAWRATITFCHLPMAARLSFCPVTMSYKSMHL